MSEYLKDPSLADIKFGPKQIEFLVNATSPDDVWATILLAREARSSIALDRDQTHALDDYIPTDDEGQPL